MKRCVCCCKVPEEMATTCCGSEKQSRTSALPGCNKVGVSLCGLGTIKAFPWQPKVVVRSSGYRTRMPWFLGFELSGILLKW